MSENNTDDAQQPMPLNTVSDKTGQLDPHFLQWRRFCAENSVDVNMLVSQLSDEQRAKWNEFKRRDLK